MGDDKQAVEDSEGDRWHGEEIHRRDGFSMVSQERKPALGGLGVPRRSFDPSRNGSFSYIEPEHSEFAVNPRRTPGRILGHHAEDQAAHLLGHSLPAHCSGHHGHRSPVEPESSPVPAHNGVGAYKDETLLPARPESSR